MSTFVDRLRQRLRELRAANGANVTMTFALATIPLVGFVGAAVDYSHANSVKAAMQAAVDATGLMLSKEVNNLTESEILTKANAYFKALFSRPEALDAHVTIDYSSGSSQVLVSGSALVKTNFMGIMGFDYLAVGAHSLAKWGNTRLRVALVLDTTGSMSSAGKMTALQTATKNLLDQLKGAATNNGDVYVSIIPFSKDVNVGAGNYNANWIYWGTTTGPNPQDPNTTDNTSWDAKYGSCKDTYGNSVSASPRSTCLSKGTCSISGKNSKGSCNSAGGTWTPATWTPNDHVTWNGCVMDRGYPQSPSNLGGKSGPDTTNNYDTNVGSTDITKMSSLYAADQYSSCSPSVMALSYDWTAMKGLVDGFYPAGMTNQAIGLAHGWMSLVGGGPYPTPPAEDPKFIYTKVIILLTDGLNTQNRWGSSQSSIDAREKITCDNVNAAKITLYAVQVNTGGDPTSTLLQNCAGSPGKYPDSSKFFLLTSASEIVSTFQQIGTKLSNLRIAK
jgi:Flp pilus assembly protein TadG